MTPSLLNRRTVKNTFLALTLLLGINVLVHPTKVVATIFKGPATTPVIALTFDDGPKPEYAIPILNILQKHRIRATFFIVGSQAEKHPDIIHRMHMQGHTIGNHSWSHPNLTTLTKDEVEVEIQKTNTLIHSITGVRPQYFRAPGGRYNSSINHIIENTNMSHVLWSINGKDYASATQLLAHPAPHPQKNPEFSTPLVNHILTKVENGAIILLHNGGNTVEAHLDGLIIQLKKEGYSFAPLNELLGQNLL
jgi:peptidoglycan/xylan/chitin deacetylase (PgdA/CDA1 family)